MALAPQTKDHTSYRSPKDLTMVKARVPLRAWVWLGEMTCTLIVTRTKKAMKTVNNLDRDQRLKKLRSNNRMTFWSTRMSGKNSGMPKSCKKSWSKSSNSWRIYDRSTNLWTQVSCLSTIKDLSQVTTPVFSNSSRRKNSTRKSVRESWMPDPKSISTLRPRII